MTRLNECHVKEMIWREYGHCTSRDMIRKECEQNIVRPPIEDACAFFDNGFPGVEVTVSRNAISLRVVRGYGTTGNGVAVHQDTGSLPDKFRAIVRYSFTYGVVATVILFPKECSGILRGVNTKGATFRRSRDHRESGQCI